jgi:hypothetical protein
VTPFPVGPYVRIHNCFLSFITHQPINLSIHLNTRTRRTNTGNITVRYRTWPWDSSHPNNLFD